MPIGCAIGWPIGWHIGWPMGWPMGWLIGIPELGIDDGMLIPMPGTLIFEAPFPSIQTPSNTKMKLAKGLNLHRCCHFEFAMKCKNTLQEDLCAKIPTMPGIPMPVIGIPMHPFGDMHPLCMHPPTSAAKSCAHSKSAHLRRCWDATDAVWCSVFSSHAWHWLVFLHIRHCVPSRDHLLAWPRASARFQLWLGRNETHVMTSWAIFSDPFHHYGKRI